MQYKTQMRDLPLKDTTLHDETHVCTYVMSMFDKIGDGVPAILPHVNCTISVTGDQVSLVIVKHAGHETGAQVRLEITNVVHVILVNRWCDDNNVIFTYQNPP